MKEEKKKSKVWLIVLLVILVVAAGVCIYLTRYAKVDTKGLTDEEIYERLQIQFNVSDDEEIYLTQKMDGSWSSWKLVKGYNGKVTIDPETIDLSKVAEYEITYKVTATNDEGVEITKEYKKTVKVAQQRPTITLKEEEITLDLNEEFNQDDWYSVENLDNWELKVECDINTAEMGKYYLTISVINPDTQETITKEMVINVVDKSVASENDGCTLVWVVDKAAVKEQGHYETVNVAEQGHWGRFLVSEEEGHWETIHHEEESHTEWDSEMYWIYTFVRRDQQGKDPSERTGDIVKTSYELAEMGMTAGDYFIYLGEDYGNYYSTTAWRYYNEHKVIDKEAWDEQVWVVDKEAVYEDRWVVDCEAYSYKVWIVDVPAQKEVGHWEKKCD